VALALAGRHAAALAGTLPEARSRLAAALAAARAADGDTPDGGHLQEDLADLVDRLAAVLPPAPGADALASAAEAPRVRRRTMLVGAGAVLLGTATWLLRDRWTEPAVPRSTLALPVDSEAWLDIRTWPPRGALGTDRDVRSFVVLAPGEEATRLLFADDVRDTRIIMGASTGTGFFPELTLRVWIGRAGDAVDRLVEQSLDPTGMALNAAIVPVALPHDGETLLVVLARPVVDLARFSPFVRLTPQGTIERTWTSIDLTDGVGSALLTARPGVAARLWCGSYHSDVVCPDAVGRAIDQGDPGERLSALVAAHTGLARASLETEVIRSRLGNPGVDLLGARHAASAWLTTVRTPDGAIVRDFTVSGLHDDDEGLWEVKPVVVPASEALAPATLVVREGAETSIVLVSVPEGAATVRIVGFGPYEGFTSATTPVTDRVAVVEAPHPVSFPPGMRIVVRDAAGRTLYAGEPSVGTDLLDL